MSVIKLQLDTNFLLDAMIEDRPQHNEACAVFDYIIDGLAIGQITLNQLVDYYYIARKNGVSDKKRREDIAFILGSVGLQNTHF